MRQIVLQQPGQFIETQVPRPLPRPGEALVRVQRIGVCGTDLHAFAGRQPFFSYPRVLGHELGVEILALPDSKSPLRVGDRCAVEPYLSCGSCHACLNGKPNCCERLQVLGVHVDGGMCAQLSVPVERLFASSSVDFDALALVETLGIGAHAVARSGLQPGEEVLIVGAGPIGLAVLQFAQIARSRIRVLELHSARQEFVRGLGAEVLGEWDGRLADVVFDATGNASAMEASFGYVAHGGRLVMVGLVQGAIRFDDPLFHRREMTILASRNSCHEFPRIIRLLEAGQIDLTPWISHRLKLREVPDQFPRLRDQPGLVKAMIEVEPSDA